MPPQLSIILVTVSPPALRAVLGRYRAQGPDRLELVVAAFPGVNLAECAAECWGFEHLRIIEASAPRLSTAEYEATVAATAPWVVYAQASAWPRAGFVDAILAARQSGSYVVIGPAVANANPRTIASRAGALIQYGEWLDSTERGPAEYVPGHSSAYDRAALRSLDDELEELLDAGSQLQVALKQRGGRCYLEPSACVEILGVSQFGPLLNNLYRQSLQYARQRRRGWPLARRALYTLGAPLLPGLRFCRIVNQRRRRGGMKGLLPLVPALLLGLSVSAAAELVGYAFGRSVDGSAAHLELRRLEYVQDDERDAALAQGMGGERR